MPVTDNDIQAAVSKCLPDAVKFLSDLIAIPSLSGDEAKAMNYAQQAFTKLADVSPIPMSDALRNDPDYSDPIPDIHYDGRNNLRIIRPGSNPAASKSLLLSTHIDTVPPSQGQSDPFSPRIVDDIIFGRGACDAKGQVAAIYLTFATIKHLNPALKGNLLGHVVVEEENGGNGTLAMVRHGEKADACIVLEPSELKLQTSIRGAVWFNITVTGKPGHSGMAAKTRSALKPAIKIVDILEKYHAQLLASSRGFPLFDPHPNPMPLTIGQFHAGNWPATAPGQATLAGVLGLLPNKTAHQVMEEMTHAIKSCGDPDVADNFTIHFSYRHDSSVIPTDHPLVTSLSSALAAADTDPQIIAMTASCDAWFYNNQINIPTVVFGPGSLSVAHSNQEQLPISDLAASAAALTRLALNWCDQ